MPASPERRAVLEPASFGQDWNWQQRHCPISLSLFGLFFRELLDLPAAEPFAPSCDARDSTPCNRPSRNADTVSWHPPRLLHRSCCIKRVLGTSPRGLQSHVRARLHKFLVVTQPRSQVPMQSTQGSFSNNYYGKTKTFQEIIGLFRSGFSQLLEIKNAKEKMNTDAGRQRHIEILHILLATFLHRCRLSSLFVFPLFLF